MQLTLLDWTVFFAYFVILAITGWQVNRRKALSSNDYFLASHAMPVWLVAVSVLATSQSAATFLGGPDMGFRGNLSYLATNIGALLAVFIVMSPTSRKTSWQKIHVSNLSSGHCLGPNK